MGLLKHWEKKKSWHDTLPLVPVYKSLTSGERDLSLSYLCDKEPKLTLTEDGFKEIVIDQAEINPEYKHLAGILPKDIRSLEARATALAEEVEKYLYNNWWNNNYPHLVFMSAGLDSRIISHVLAKLRNTYGDDWIGDIHFRCHGAEWELFEQVMKAQRWKPSQYSVYKKDELNDLDYYPIAEFSSDANGFIKPTIEFWDDLKLTEKKTTIINGLFGGEIFSYPLFPKRQFSENRYNDLIKNIGLGIPKLSKLYNKWGDVLMPFLSYGYLDIAFRVSEECFKWAQTKHNQGRDLMRTSMLNLFNDDIPLYIGHDYNIKISEERGAYIKKMYQNSRLYKDYKHLDFVENARPDLLYLSDDKKPIWRSVLDLKLYGLATMYENTKQ